MEQGATTRTRVSSSRAEHSTVRSPMAIAGSLPATATARAAHARGGRGSAKPWRDFPIPAPRGEADHGSTALPEGDVGSS